MTPTVLAALAAAAIQPPEPAVHVVRAECLSTTVTKSAVVRSTFAVVGGDGRYAPFEVEYFRPAVLRRPPGRDLLIIRPFEPGEEAFWVVTEAGPGQLAAVVAPGAARAYLPDLSRLTRPLNSGALGGGAPANDGPEAVTAKTLAGLVSATVEPEMRDRLPSVLQQHRRSTDPVIREFVRWHDAKTPAPPAIARNRD